MRVIAKLALLLVILRIAAFAAPAEKPNIQALRARADVAQGQTCAEVCLEAAQALVEDSDKQFTDGHPDVGHQEMKDAADYAGKAVIW
jgi:hypothetical protein